ncbi:hypothetical protein HC766_00500 [Candidatus Gracilibacteria bacterium]|nr:hypothetical protein [Candidatus Gracilibacteria bacterium]
MFDSWLLIRNIMECYERILLEEDIDNRKLGLYGDIGLTKIEDLEKNYRIALPYSLAISISYFRITKISRQTLKLLGIFDSFFDSSNSLRIETGLINNFTIVFVPKTLIFIELIDQKIFRIKFTLVGLDKNIWLSK